jgi:hypothetical protein
MANEDYFQVGLAHAEPREIGTALVKNTPSMAGVAILAVAYVVGSAAGMRAVEHLTSWTFGQTLYFTALNVVAGDFQLGFEPATRLGRMLAVINPLVGLILFGVFIALLTMTFQPTEYSVMSSGSGRPPGGGGGAPPPPAQPVATPKPATTQTDASGRDLPQKLTSEISRAQEQAQAREARGENASEQARTAADLRRAHETLLSAQRQVVNAEQALRDAETLANSALAEALFHIGHDHDIRAPLKATFRKPDKPSGT